MPPLTNYFVTNYPTAIEEGGRNWVALLPDSERQAFSQYGRHFAEHGHLGGIARAQSAKRDHRGRFIKGGQ